MELKQKRDWITQQFEEFYEDRKARIEVTSGIYASLCFLSDEELDAVEAAIDMLKTTNSWDKYWGSIGHDIHGMAARDPYFVPRLVGRKREVAK